MWLHPYDSDCYLQVNRLSSNDAMERLQSEECMVKPDENVSCNGIRNMSINKPERRPGNNKNCAKCRIFYLQLLKIKNNRITLSAGTVFKFRRNYYAGRMLSLVTEPALLRLFVFQRFQCEELWWECGRYKIKIHLIDWKTSMKTEIDRDIMTNFAVSGRTLVHENCQLQTYILEIYY